MKKESKEEKPYTKIEKIALNAQAGHILKPDETYDGLKNEKRKEGETVFFEGETGQQYRFIRHPHPFPYRHINSDNLPDKGAVYIFTRAENQQCIPLYIGQKHHIISSIQYHKKWYKCVRERLGNSICIYFEEDLNTRLQIVSDLISKHHPPCNNL
ncbi:MAG: hypothetical protein OXM61_17090 [Candidatus Poribacteria bacterium]|nr:hypothetical protein [Candidatus Poribacteria bacterium]